MRRRAPRAGGCRTARAIAITLGVLGLLAPASAAGAVDHVVAPGESLWSIAAGNNLTTRTVAVFNGLAEDALLIEGETIQVPTVDEGAAALAAVPAPASASAQPAAGRTVQPGESLWSIAAANGLTTEALASANGLAADALLIAGETISIPGAPASAAAPAPAAATDPATGLAYVWSPSGSVPLDPGAAASFEAMRQASLSQFGIDLYPAGLLSGYRTYEQQASLYDLYLSGQGAPANPPGSSSHEYGAAVDLAEPVMREIVDQIGGAYGWAATIPSEWWHVAYVG